VSCLLVGIVTHHNVDLALATGEVYACGDATFGQIGNGMQGGYVASPTQVKFPDGTKIIQISVGKYFTLALSGTVSL
jgi:alpha-tubulin suppressor-like RCC1 family protein